MQRSLLVWLLSACLLGFGVACDRSKSAQQAPPPPPDVVVAAVEQRTVPIIRDFTARTEAVPTVEIRARVAGVLEEALFKEGTEAKKGQILFVIQQAEYKAALETARAQLAKAQADLTRARDTSVVDRFKAVVEQRQADLGKAHQDVERYRPLAAAKAIPQQDLDTAIAAEKVAVAGVDAAQAQLRDARLAQRTEIQLSEAAVQSAKASIIQAALNLSYTTIEAPITGIIGKLMVDRGNLVGKADPTLLATISAVDPIYVDFNVAEVDYLRLASRISLDPGGAHRRRRRRSSSSWPTTASSRTRAASRSSTGRWTPRRAPSGYAPSCPTRPRCSVPGSSVGCGPWWRSARTRCSCPSSPCRTSKATRPSSSWSRATRWRSVP